MLSCSEPNCSKFGRKYVFGAIFGYNPVATGSKGSNFDDMTTTIGDLTITLVQLAMPCGHPSLSDWIDCVA